MKIKQYLYILILIVASCKVSYAQVFVEGNARFIDNIKTEIPLIILPQISIDNSKIEEEKISRSKLLKYAENIIIDINVKDRGVCLNKANGDKIWYLKIRSQNAYSLGLLFDYYRVPVGAELFVYSTDQQHIRGAYTYLNNKSNYILPVSAVKGEELIIEYYEPNNVDFEGVLHISSIAHDYMNIFKLLKEKSALFGNSGACNVNVNCEDDVLWQTLKHSVCKITYNGRLCSGTLINNTNNDGHPYLLTANHCINNEFDANSAIFYFNFESPNCINEDGSEDQSIAGSTIIATPPFKTIDFSLLELSLKPTPDYKPYYAGWNRDIINPQSVTSIHHPVGDIKKISKAYQGAVQSDYGEGYNEFTHWWIDTWDEGTTEDGSSGSPLFDQHGLIIGDLSGGDASCSFNFNDYYQQFSYSWDFYSSPNQQLKNWLDSKNKGDLILDGYKPYDTIPSNLRASVRDTIINLKWNVPFDTLSVEKYYIYRNSFKYDSVNINEYSDINAYKDTFYSYWVTSKHFVPSVFESDSSNVVYVRAMDPIVTPFGEDFESGNTIPYNWYQEKSIDSEEWVFKEGGSNGILDTAFEGSVNAYFYGLSGKYCRLILPRFDMSLNTNVAMSFYIHMNGILDHIHSLNILYKEEDSLKWEVIQSFNQEISTWEKQKVILPKLSNNYQIAFEGIGKSGFGIAIDSIKIDEDLGFFEPDILTSKDTICIIEDVEFSTSVDNSHSIFWNFGDNVLPNSAIGAGPHAVQYLTPGLKSVEITVDDAYRKKVNDIVAVYEVPKPSFTNQRNVLKSSLNYGNQWYLDGEKIDGAVNRTYTIEADGNYYVKVTNSLNCSSTSDNDYIIVSGVEDIVKDELYDKVRVYPNPNDGAFVISIDREDSQVDYDFSIVDLTGRICESGVIYSYEDYKEINKSNLNEGIYFLRIYTNKHSLTKKILIKK
jgi:hypothetical protein